MADFNEYKGVWVFCEQRQGALMSTDFELVSEARKLADELGCEVTGLLLGDNVEGIAKELGGYGADKVMVCDSPLLKDYTTDAYAKVVCDMVNEYKPEVNERELTPYLNFADVSAGEKRRMVAMVRTSGNSGYYVDIFRSDRADNDYLFHHVGTSMEITDSEGSKLPGEALEKFDKTWHEGYHWFSNLHKSDYNQNFIASWSMPEDITARLWMTGGEGREIYQVDAPPTTMNKGLTPGDICMPPMPTPALIVRQEGNNAHTHPFVSVYEAYKKSGPNVLGVEALQGDDGCTGVKVNTADGYADYLFSATDMQAHHPSKRVSFCGGLGLIREKEGQIQLMYLGCGRSLKKGNFVLESDHDVYAAIYMQHGVWYYSATGPVRVKIGKETKELNEGYNQKL